MVAHGVEEHLGRNFRARFDPQGHTVLLVVTHRVVGITVHVVRYRAEERPYACLAAAQGAEIGRRIGIAKTEIRIRALVKPRFACEGDYVRSVEAVLGIIERKGGDARLVGMARNISVGNTACHPDDAFADVVALPVQLASFADEFHDPRLVPVGDREGFAARGVAVGVGQVGDHADRFAGRAGALQGDVDERAVIDPACRVFEDRKPTEGGFGDDERMFVHVTHGLEGLGRLRDFAEVAPRVPFVNRHHRAGLVCARAVLVERPVEGVRVGGIGDHDRSVG